MADKNQILKCPLMSAGQDIDKLCLQEKCAWYVQSTKTCAIYLLAHNALLEIKQKQK